MKAFRRKASPRKKGIGLVELIVGVGIMAVLAIGLAQMYKNSFSAQNKLQLSNDLEAIRTSILSGIDCGATFGSVSPVINPASPGSYCNSTSAAGGQVGPYLRLYRKTLTGEAQPLTGALSGGVAKLGGWHIRASCSASEQSLVIRAARIAPDGSFMKDPLNQKLQDWNAAAGLIFGGAGTSGAMPVCFSANSAVPQHVMHWERQDYVLKSGEAVVACDKREAGGKNVKSCAISGSAPCFKMWVDGSYVWVIDDAGAPNECEGGIYVATDNPAGF